METKYRLAVIFNIIPAVVNIIVSVWFFVSFTGLEFRGYLLGTILGIILSVIWLVQVRKASGTHAIRLLKLTYKWFFAKFAVLVVFIAGVYYLIEFSREWFVVSFFVALAMSAVVELWFYSSISKDS